MPESAREDLEWALENAQSELLVHGLGEGVKRLMRERGVSYRAMAESLDVPLARIQRILANTTPLTGPQLTNVCDRLEANPEDIQKLCRLKEGE